MSFYAIRFLINNDPHHSDVKESHDTEIEWNHYEFHRISFLLFLEVQALLRDKADPNVQDCRCETPLLQAAAQGDLDVGSLAPGVGVSHCL